MSTYSVSGISNAILNPLNNAAKNINSVAPAINDATGASSLTGGFNFGGVGGVGSGSGGTTTGNGADLSAYDQSITGTNQQLNNLTPQLNNLLQGVYNSYQDTLNGLNQTKATTDQQYNTTKTQNSQDYVSGKNAINTNTGNTISGIDRLAGAHGAGGQSAVNYAALLAGKAGTQQRAGAANTFGRNEQNLDQGYGNFMNNYNQNLTTAGQQRDQGENSVRSQIATSRANLLQSLASLVNQRTAAAGGSGTAASQPYINQATQAMNEATSYGTPRPVAAMTPLTYTAPSLDHYTVNPTAISAGQNNSAATDSAIPFLQTLLGRDKQLQGA